MGGQGALFVEAEEQVHARAEAVAIRSTVGAGDAMVAGLVTAKTRGLSLPDCARLATAFSIGALGQLGPHLPEPRTVETLMERVVIRTLD
jgi:fructose-1-phosphate kinase PfkB-like protein